MTSYIKQNFESGHFLEAKELNYSEKGLEQSFRIIEKLCPPLILEDNFISCFPLKGAPLNPKSKVKLTQEGKGEPFPGGEGRNLIPFPYSGATESAGITWTDNQDGSITIEGTTTNYSMFTLSDKLNLENEKTYYLSQGAHLYIYYLNEKGEDCWETVVLTWKNTYVFKSIYLQINPNETINKTVWPYLNEGSLDPEWTPYANIRPIRGLNEATLTRCCGKNLFDNNSEKLEEITYINKDFISVSRWGHLINLPVGTYTMRPTLAGETQNDYIYITVLDKNMKVVLEATGTNGHLITPGSLNKKQIIINDPTYKLFLYNANSSTTKEATAAILNRYNIMLNAGDIALEYEPYQGETYTVQLNNTLYGGYIDWNAGALVITHEGKVLDGTSEENNSYSYKWYSGGSGTTLYYAIAIGEKFTYNRGKIVCSHYPYSEVGSTTSKQNCIHLANSSTNLDIIIVRPNLTKYSDLDSWKNFLKDNSITVAYELTIPKIIPLTPQNITALPGLNNIWSNAEKVEIFGYANPLHIIEEQTATINNYETRIAALENAVLNNN